MAVTEEEFIGALNDLHGKVAIVTGGAGTIGYQSALYLAAKGCKVYIADIAPRLSDAAKSSDLSAGTCIAGAGGRVENSNPELIHSHVLDLSSVKTAVESAHQFLAQESRLDVVLASAAILHASQERLSPDGWERTWAVTHLGHFVFMNALLPLLKKSAAIGSPSRISFVTSNSYESAAPPDYERLRTVMPNDHNHTGFLARGLRRYQVAKVCNVYYVLGLSSRIAAETRDGEEPSVLINCCHPGVNGRTSLGSAVLHPWIEILIKGVVSLFSHSPRDCAKTGVYLAANPGVGNRHITGEYWQPEWSWLGYWTGCKRHNYTPLGLDVEQQEECWRQSEATVAQAQKS